MPVKQYPEYQLTDFESYTNKTKLSSIFGITRRSLHNYHQIALENCDEFSDDYPLFQGKRYTEAPLTQYQCWVLWRIYYWMHLQNMPKKILEEQLIESRKFQKGFSKQVFYSIYTVNEVQNDTTTICRVA